MATADDKRRFSGEMMTPEGPVLDADFVSLPRLAGAAPQMAQPAMPSDKVPGGMDILQRDARSLRRSGGPVFWLMAAAIVFCSFWIAGGHVLIRHALAEAGGTPVAISR